LIENLDGNLKKYFERICYGLASSNFFTPNIVTITQQAGQENILVFSLFLLSFFFLI